VIAEALDAAVTLGWALAAWFVLFAVAATAAGFTLVAVPAVACIAATRGVAAGLAAVQRSAVPEVESGAQDAAHARTDTHAPTWALPQPIKET
jgi:hypothetical protein